MAIRRYRDPEGAGLIRAFADCGTRCTEFQGRRSGSCRWGCPRFSSRRSGEGATMVRVGTAIFGAAGEGLISWRSGFLRSGTWGRR